MTSRPSWRLRTATVDDAELLAGFRCATTSAPWDIEVERFVNTSLIAWATDPHADDYDPRALLLFDATGAVVGVGAHEVAALSDEPGVSIRGTKLEVAALSVAWQGRAFTTDERASDVLISALLTDVQHRVPPRYARVFAIVHEDNTRSLRLLERFGFTAEMPRTHPNYRRLVTE